ncbi:ATP-binding protein [Heliorestis convoluta]|uniref:AAA family ATPase n=1 Tax=Heliorestis convoluta TaxID=356322 RepID=A0A5Q2N4U9_9FIRM|nr:ATP-binding protein [Heliorestis convoluta]QGG48636.1 AAA family ATPase [Heliorestis convoluta]
MAEFHMLCGIPGSGKSTLVNKLSGYLVSTDKIREFLWGNASILDKDQLVFHIAKDVVQYMLARNEDVIFDATNLTRRNRRPFLKIAKNHQAKVTLHLVRTTLPTALQRNAQRQRKVPEAAIRSLHHSFQMPTLSEQIDRIVIYNEE